MNERIRKYVTGFLSEIAEDLQILNDAYDEGAHLHLRLKKDRIVFELLVDRTVTGFSIECLQILDTLADAQKLAGRDAQNLMANLRRELRESKPPVRLKTARAYSVIQACDETSKIWIEDHHEAFYAIANRGLHTLSEQLRTELEQRFPDTRFEIEVV